MVPWLLHPSHGQSGHENGYRVGCAARCLPWPKRGPETVSQNAERAEDGKRPAEEVEPRGSVQLPWSQACNVDNSVCLNFRCSMQDAGRAQLESCMGTPCAHPQLLAWVETWENGARLISSWADDGLDSLRHFLLSCDLCQFSRNGYLYMQLYHGTYTGFPNRQLHQHCPLSPASPHPKVTGCRPGVVLRISRIVNPGSVPYQI